MISYRKVLVVVLLILTYANPAFAGFRSPGKYVGIPVFDRWDGCILYSGIYVMYVSEKVKENLRPYSGRAVVIDAKDVYQPINPGDGRIGAFKYLGPALEKRHRATVTGLKLTSSVKVDTQGKVIATISIKNTGKKSVKLLSQELALTLLTKRSKSVHRLFVADGPSFALITRTNFELITEPRWRGEGFADGKSYSWTIGKENALPHDFMLEPSETRNVHIHFDLPSGEYDFLGGYGGGVLEGKCLASNLTAFDVGEDGEAKVVVIEGR